MAIAGVTVPITVLAADPVPMPSLSIPSFTLPIFKIGVDVNFQLPAIVGGAWLATNLPPGVTCDPDGLVHGKPTAEQIEVPANFRVTTP